MVLTFVHSNKLTPTVWSWGDVVDILQFLYCEPVVVVLMVVPKKMAQWLRLVEERNQAGYNPISAPFPLRQGLFK